MCKINVFFKLTFQTVERYCIVLAFFLFCHSSSSRYEISLADPNHSYPHHSCQQNGPCFPWRTFTWCCPLLLCCFEPRVWGGEVEGGYVSSVVTKRCKRPSRLSTARCCMEISFRLHVWSTVNNCGAHSVRNCCICNSSLRTLGISFS